METKETRSVTIRVSLEDAEMLTELGNGSINRGVSLMTSRIRVLTKMAESEIKGIFTEQEWKFMADSLNGVIIDDAIRYSTENLAYHNEDAKIYDRMDEKWGVDVAELNKKVMQLTSAQVDAVYRRIERFWSENAELDEWAKY